MSAGEDQKSPHELVIVKRRGGGHGDGHHGGAWKIAFADFMTALMCFFLVMWLINSTDKKTITQIATYFNPLRLNDRLPSQKGLNDPAPAEMPADNAKDKSKPDKKEKKASKGKDNAESSKDASAASSESMAGKGTDDARDGGERELLRNPYGVLERIAAGEERPPASRMPTDAMPTGMPRDMFDLLPARPADNGASKEEKLAKQNARAPQSVAVPEPASRRPEAASPSPAHGTNIAIQGETKAELELQISQALAELNTGARPGVEIIERDNEVLISITDEHDFGMFAIASARPTRELVIVMERIAKVLAGTQGTIVLRGHTDGRPYRSAEYDNWRLSAARAQVAFYMLARGGMQEARVKRIEGHADRTLRNAADPLAAQNRRIEILLMKAPK